MADRSAALVVRPIWMKQAEEAKQKNEAEKAAAAKAAFEATFKAVDKTAEKAPADDSSDSDAEDESRDLKNKPVGPVDPSKCTAAGAGIAGGTACAPSSFVITTKDSDGRKILTGGAQMKVRISPGVGVGGPDQDGMLKDLGDGTYTVTYAVPKRGNYMVHVECNGRPIMGSPFPVFFSAGTPGAGLLGTPTPSPFPNLVNQTMPNMPNYSGSVSGAFPGLLGMIPGVLNGASGGAILPGVGASLGEVCREYLNGRCSKSDCKFNHPPHNLLMTALAATTTMGTLSQVPMAPSAAAMAAAQAIVAAQALQAHAAQVQAQVQTAADSGSPDKAGKADALKKTLQVSNLSPLLTAEQLKQLFSYCGTVVECSITDSKHFAYIEYSKPEEATAALALNNMDVGGRPLNVEMAKSLPSKSAIGNPMHQSSLPMVMQQAVAMQQMQFQQALMMQQTMASQQAASRAATMKSATEMASARAAEISKKLKADGVGNEDKEGARKSRSPSTSRPRSKSRSRSPIKYRHSRRSRSFSPPVRYSRDRRSRSPFRSRYHKNHFNERRAYRDVRDSYSRGGRRNWERERERERELEQERSRDHYSSVSRRHRSRSMSPRTRRSSRAGSASPKHHRESVSPRMRKSSQAASKSPRHRRESRSSPRRNHEPTSHRSRRSRSKSAEGRRRSDDAKDMGKSGKLKRDDGKLAKSRDDVEEPDLFAKDLEDSMEDRITDSPTSTHKKSSLLPEDRALKDEKDVSKSAEGRHHSDDVKDTRKSEKSKPDHGDLNKSREDFEEPDLVAKDLEDLREDRSTDSPTLTNKKSSLLPEDRAFKDEKGASKHETCGLDDGNSEKTEAVIKNEDLLENNSMDLLEDKRTPSPPISKSRKESSAAAGDRPRTGSDDLSRRDKLSPEYRKRERTDSVKEQDSLVDDLGRRNKLSPEYRKRERTDSVKEQDSLVDGLGRRGKLSPEYRKHERTDSRRERGSLIDDSKYSREDRRASDSSKSRSHRRSLKPLDDGSSRSKDDRNRREESKREHVKHDKTHSVRKERNYLDYDSSDSREDRRVSSSKRKTHVRSSPSLEDGTSRDRNRREESKQEHVKLDKTRPVTKERDYLEYDSSDSREDRRVSSSKRKTRTRSSPLLEDGTSRDRKDRNRHEMSRRETRKSARTDHSTKMEDFNDGNLEGLRQDEKVHYSSKLSTRKRDSMSEDDVTSMDVKDLSGCEVADRKLDKTDSIIKEQDCIGQDSDELIGDGLSDFPELVQGSSTPDGGRSRGAKGRSRHEKSTSKEGKFEKTCNVKGQDYSDDDSVDSREDRKAADSPISKAQKRSLMSPKDRNSIGTEDEKPHKKPKLEHESVSGFGGPLARDDDEHGFHDGSPSLHVGNYQDSAKLSSPSPSSSDHV